MARLHQVHMQPGQPTKPTTLSPAASRYWDRFVAELTASGVSISLGHRTLLTQAATISADIADAWEVIETEGAYLLNEKTGASAAHPAAKRLDGLRRDLIKVLGLLGIRGPAEGKAQDSLEDALSDD